MIIKKAIVNEVIRIIKNQMGGSNSDSGKIRKIETELRSLRGKFKRLEKIVMKLEKIVIIKEED